jgi:probable phosphoglycerate mutase
MDESASRTRLILVRHGATEWTESGRYQGGTTDIPLSATGRSHARRAAAALAPLRLAEIVCSPLRRAVETATCIAAPHRLTATPSPAFREVGLGDWEGLTSSEAAARNPESYRQWHVSPATVLPPGGEALQEAAGRVIAAFDDIVARRAGKKVVCISHSLIIRLLVSHALGAGLSTVGRIRCQPGSISVIDVRAGQLTVRALNDTCHLQEIREPAEDLEGRVQIRIPESSR